MEFVSDYKTFYVKYVDTLLPNFHIYLLFIYKQSVFFTVQVKLWKNKSKITSTVGIWHDTDMMCGQMDEMRPFTVILTRCKWVNVWCHKRSYKDQNKHRAEHLLSHRLSAVLLMQTSPRTDVKLSSDRTLHVTGKTNKTRRSLTLNSIHHTPNLLSVKISVFKVLKCVAKIFREHRYRNRTSCANTHIHRGLFWYIGGDLP